MIWQGDSGIVQVCAEATSRLVLMSGRDTRVPQGNRGNYPTHRVSSSLVAAALNPFGPTRKTRPTKEVGGRGCWLVFLCPVDIFQRKFKANSNSDYNTDMCGIEAACYGQLEVRSGQGSQISRCE